MKTLIVVRHAKSNWSDTGMDDRDRPLNDRGRKDAPEMAKRLHKRAIPIDLFLSSPAKRALTTAHYFAAAFKVGKDAVAIAERLYEAQVATFYEITAGLPDQYQTVILFSHNPGITYFANTLSEVQIDNMPTCAIFAVAAATDNWALFENASKQFLFFDYPKNPSQ